MAQAKADIIPMAQYASLNALPPQQLDQLLLETQQRYMEAAQQAAPLAYLLQLARELVAIRMLRLAGQASVEETAALTEVVVAQMAQTGLLTQVVIDGLHGKVPDAVIDKIAEVQGTALEGSSLIHAVVTGGILERIQQFKAPSSEVGRKDIVSSLLTRKVPGKLMNGRR